MGCFVLLKIDKNIGNLCAILHSENPEAVFLIGSQNHINKSMKFPKNDEKTLKKYKFGHFSKGRIKRL